MEKEVKSDEVKKDFDKKTIKMTRVKRKNHEKIDLTENENKVNIEKQEVSSHLSKIASNKPKTRKKKNINDDLELNEEKKVEEDKPVENAMKNYQITGHSIQQSFIFFDYLDDVGKSINTELVDKDDLGWYCSVKKYCQKQKFDKGLLTGFLDRWKLYHKSKYPNYNFDESPKVLHKIIKLKENLITDQERKKETVNIERKFNDAFRTLIRRERSEYMKHLMRSNLYYKSLKYTDKEYILEVDVDAYQKKYNMDKRMYDTLKHSPKVLYHPLLIYHMICHANETKNKHLWDMAQSLINDCYKEEAQKLFNRFNIMNGSSDAILSIEDYSKHQKVKDILNESSLTNLNLIKSYSEKCH